MVAVTRQTLANPRFEPTAPSALRRIGASAQARAVGRQRAAKGDKDGTKEVFFQGWHLFALFVAFARIGRMWFNFKSSGDANLYTDPYTYNDTNTSPTNTSTSTPLPTRTPVPTNTPTLTSTPNPFIDVFPEAQSAKQGVTFTCAVILPFASSGCAHSGSHGVEIAYATTNSSCGADWYIMWTDTDKNHYDTSAFKSFAFWIKGQSSGKVLTVYVVTDKQWIQVSSPNITTEWQKVTIPINLPAIEQITFRFQKISSNTTFCIDDMSFTP